MPQYWIRGLIVGRDFTERTQAYLEIYDQQDANRIDGAAKQRETTLGAGGRQALNRDKSIVLLLMGGPKLPTYYVQQRPAKLDSIRRSAVSRRPP